MQPGGKPPSKVFYAAELKSRLVGDEFFTTRKSPSVWADGAHWLSEDNPWWTEKNDLWIQFLLSTPVGQSPCARSRLRAVA